MLSTLWFLLNTQKQHTYVVHLYTTATTHENVHCTHLHVPQHPSLSLHSASLSRPTVLRTDLLSNHQNHTRRVSRLLSCPLIVKAAAVPPEIGRRVRLGLAAISRETADVGSTITAVSS